MAPSQKTLRFSPILPLKMDPQPYTSLDMEEAPSGLTPVLSIGVDLPYSPTRFLALQAATQLPAYE